MTTRGAFILATITITIASVATMYMVGRSSGELRAQGGMTQDAAAYIRKTVEHRKKRKK